MTSYINAHIRATGHLWQGRFGSVVMDEPHLAHAVRYVSLHPVRAKLVACAQDWKWSSVAAHLSERNDGLVTVVPVLERYGDFSTFLGQNIDEHQTFRDLRRAEVTGRPFGNEKCVIT